jgi:AraC-like DNA-binding protein
MNPHVTFCEKTENRDGILSRKPLPLGGDDGMVLFLIKGSLLVRTEKYREHSSDHVLREGDIMLLRSDTDCYLYSEDPATFWQVRFKGEAAAGIPPFFTPYDRVRLIELIYLLDDYKKHFYPADMLDAVLYVLFGEIRVQAESGGHPDAPLFQRICEYIGENTDRELTVREIAEHFNYNSQYISRFFRRFDREGIRNYMISARINQIKFLLLTTDMSLKEISEKLGFRDYKLFLKYYKYHENMSPNEFRAVFSPQKTGKGSGRRNKQ